MADALLSFSSLTHGMTCFPGSAPSFWFPDSDGHSPSWHRASVDRYLGTTPPWHGLGDLSFHPTFILSLPPRQKKKNYSLPVLMGLILGCQPPDSSLFLQLFGCLNALFFYFSFGHLNSPFLFLSTV